MVIVLKSDKPLALRDSNIPYLSVNVLSIPELLQRTKAAPARKNANKPAPAPEEYVAVGKELGDVLRAQWKFTSFLLAFGLTPPLPRPKAWPIDWSPPAMKKILSLVYKYRSEALHESKPFPLPMCEPPFPSEDATGTPAWSERPCGHTYQAGAFWTEDKLPINIHAFHHVVETAILRWWSTVAARPRPE